MKTQSNESLLQRRLAGAIGSILIIGGGIVAVIPATPNAAAQALITPPEGTTRLSLRCKECGIVTSALRIDLAANSPSKYEISVRMTDGTSRNFTAPAHAQWRQGERVIIIDGANGLSEAE
jgi:hypothetical protein